MLTLAIDMALMMALSASAFSSDAIPRQKYGGRYSIDSSAALHALSAELRRIPLVGNWAKEVFRARASSITIKNSG
jgi:hypothetical protein